MYSYFLFCAKWAFRVAKLGQNVPAFGWRQVVISHSAFKTQITGSWSSKQLTTEAPEEYEKILTGLANLTKYNVSAEQRITQHTTHSYYTQLISTL